ncbi:phage virion morphogenesis protein, partial [Cutibacterium acnes]
AGRLQAAVGTNRVYARIHQLGGKAGRNRKVTIPARPFLGINADDRQMIGEILNDHLAMAVRR